MAMSQLFVVVFYCFVTCSNTLFFTFREFLIGTECFQTKVTTIQANKLSNNNKKYERNIPCVQNFQLSLTAKINCLCLIFLKSIISVYFSSNGTFFTVDKIQINHMKCHTHFDSHSGEIVISMLTTNKCSSSYCASLTANIWLKCITMAKKSSH